MASVTVDDHEVQIGLDDFDATIRASLLNVEQALNQELLSRIRSVAPQHSGRFVKSLSGRTYATDTGVWSEVIDKDYIASFIEYGAVIPPHEILPNVAQALSFMDDGHHIITGRVESPGGKIKAEHILTGQLQAMEDEIVAALQSAVDDAASLF